MRSGLYLAASMRQKSTIAARTERLRALGVRINSSWPFQPERAVLTEADMLEIAERDLRELLASELVIVDTNVLSSTQGWHSEVGAAGAAGITLWVIAADRAAQTNVFLRKGARWFSSYEEAEAALLERSPVKSASDLSAMHQWNVSD